MANKTKKKKTNIPIPEHSTEALREVENMGILYFEYANYEGNHIVAYKKWGRGYMRVIFERETDGE